MGCLRAKCQCCTLTRFAKQTSQPSFKLTLYLRRVKVIDALTPLLPRDALLALPDRVHVAVVHALAQQILLELEAAGARGRVS